MTALQKQTWTNKRKAKAKGRNRIRIKARKENYKNERNERTAKTRAEGGRDKVLTFLQEPTHTNR
jgi:hypothetical protein